MNTVYVTLLGVLLGIFGCDGRVTKKLIPATQSNVFAVPPKILPGNRPASVRGAKLYLIDDFIVARKENRVAKDEWVCVEGYVEHSGERMGMSYLTLHHSGDKLVFSCEGANLRKYQCDTGTLVVVHGKVFGVSALVDASLISAQELDSESRPAQIP